MILIKKNNVEFKICLEGSKENEFVLTLYFTSTRGNRIFIIFFATLDECMLFGSKVFLCSGPFIPTLLRHKISKQRHIKFCYSKVIEIV